MSHPTPPDFRRIFRAVELLDKIQRVNQQLIKYMKELDDLEAQVHANDDVEASAVILINGIAARIAAAGVDPAKLNALTSSLRASAEALSAAVAANTEATDTGGGESPPPTNTGRAIN
jgi:hypothetical protein